MDEIELKEIGDKEQVMVYQYLFGLDRVMGEAEREYEGIIEKIGIVK